MKSVKRKLVFFSQLLIAAAFAACGSDKNTAKAETPQNTDTYKAEYETVFTDQAPYKAAALRNGTVFFAVYEEMTGTRLFYLPLGQNTPTEVTWEKEEGKWITAMGKDTEENLLLACGLYKEDTEKLELIKVSGEGKILSTIDITAIFDNNVGFEAQDILGDMEGNYYIVHEQCLSVIDAEGRLLYSLDTGEKISDLFFSGDGKIMLLYGGKLNELSVQKEKLIPADSDIIFPDGIYEAGMDGDILYSSGDNLYACNVGDKEAVKILNWTNNDINSNNLQCFTLLEDGRIAAFVSQSVSQRGESEFITLSKQDPSTLPEKEEKEILTFARRYSNTTINDQILRFNKTNTKYKIEVKLYGDESTGSEEVKMLLQKDIASGNAPDIIDIGIPFSDADRQELTGMGLLENLNPFLMQEPFQKEDYFEQILNIYQRNDCLYAIMPSFGLKFLAGINIDIESAPSWSLDEMISYMEAVPESKQILPGVDRQEMLSILLMLNYEEFMNRDTGEYNFTGQNFQRILEFAAAFPEESDKKFYWFNEVDKIKNQEVPLMKWSAISIKDLQILDFLYDDPVDVTGYPCSLGKGIIAFPCSSVVGICSGSDNKEGAWEFISYLLQENQQYEVGISGADGFPVHKAALDKVLDKMMEKEYEKDEDGNLIEKEKGFFSVGMHDDIDREILTIPYYASTESDCKCLYTLIDYTGNTMESLLDQKILEIISEESEAYFSGQKAVNDTMEMIQSRVQIYGREKN